MTPIFTLETSTGPGYNLSTDVARLVALWQSRFKLACRAENPISAALTATLSTAETWRLIR